MIKKDTFLGATAKIQRETLYDEIQEIKTSISSLKKGLHVSSFFGGFAAVFTAVGGWTVVNYFRKMGG